MEYVVFVHKNTKENTTAEEWSRFFDRARESGMFKGGDGFGINYTVGNLEVSDITETLSGMLRFDTEDFEALFALLRSHPVVVKGGSLSMCEVPKSFS